MIEHAVLTAIGADRPGLVEAVSEFVFRHGGNIEDSRMANLRGQFTMMLLVSAPAASLHNMKAAAPILIQKTHLHIEIRARRRQQPPARKAIPYRLTASAMDQAGLVHRIAHLLRAMDVNIESMQTTLVAAPYTGAPVFEMDVAIAVPTELPLSQLRQKLEELCDEMNVNWQISSMS